MKKINILILAALSFLCSCQKDDSSNSINEAVYEQNEDGTNQDFLTPIYYNVNETGLRNEINKFVHFVRLEDYQNPFQKPDGTIESYSKNRGFGDGIGLRGTSQHHPAIDLHPTNSTEISIYAAHEGIVNTYRDSSKYRHYLTITKEIKDSENNTIGKLVTVYAHVDLDLDESGALQLNGMFINQGEIVSKNLYSETMGGPHLHFEIRFYRNSEIGNEEVYNWKNSDIYTNQSSGVWSYGYWNPEIGYGFGNPINQGIE